MDSHVYLNYFTYISYVHKACQNMSLLYNFFTFCLPHLLQVSLHLRLDTERDTENAENLWNCEVIKAIAHLTMESWMVAEVKEGLDFGQQVDLPSNLTFSPPFLAKLFVSEGYARPFSHLRLGWYFCC